MYQLVTVTYLKAEKEEHLSRKPLDCEHAEKYVNVDAVISVLAIPYCGTALAAVGYRTYSFVLLTAKTATYQQAKLRRWGLVRLIMNPLLNVGQAL